MLTFNLDERSVTALNEMFDNSYSSIDKQIFVPFRDFNYGTDNAFIICHGTINGTIIIGTHGNYKEYTSIEVLSLLHTHLKQDKIKNVYVICCYAGLLPKVTIDGITIQGVCLDKCPIGITYDNNNITHNNYKATIYCTLPLQELIA